MKKFLLAGSILTALSFSALTSKAQNDSTYFDLGRVRVKKSFTQAITVKGADLEKFPTTNLSDALKVWFYGINTNSSSTIYVVDGNLITDVNAYSIYDIEEVSFIQNALVQLNGAYANKQLVVITTVRQRNKKSGVIASAMANAIARSHEGSPNQPDNSASTTRLYQEYNLGGFTNTDKVRFGLSGNYQRDAQPSLFDERSGNNSTIDDLSFRRIRLFGYAEQQLFKGTTAGLKLNYVNQKGATNNYNPAVIGGSLNSFQSKQNYFNGEVYVTSNIYQGLKNHISFNYNRNRPVIFGYSTGQFGSNQSLDSIKNRTILLKDNLSYVYTTGALEIEPAINLIYRHANSSAASRSVRNNTPPGFPATDTYTSTSNSSASQLTITPSVSLTYKTVFNLQGGYMRLLNLKSEGSYETSSTKGSYSDKFKERSLPFVNASVNTADLISSLKITGYASYSKSVVTGDGFVNLDNYDNSVIGYGGSYLFDFSNITAAYVNSDKIFHSTVLGAKVDLLQSKLSFGYNYDRRRYNVFYQYFDGTGNIYNSSPIINYTSQRFEATFETSGTNKFSWISNLNASHIKMDLVDETTNAPVSSGTVYGKKMWSGGWANRLTAGKVSAGLDLLYLFSVKDNYAYAAANNKLKPLSLQNIYVGYTFTAPRVKQLQVFVNARNLIHTVNSSLTDERYFIGGGVSAIF